MVSPHHSKSKSVHGGGEGEWGVSVAGVRGELSRRALTVWYGGQLGGVQEVGGPEGGGGQGQWLLCYTGTLDGQLHLLIC